MREFLVLALASLALAPSLPAQEAPPAPKGPGVQITFLPPPMDGTLSLGVFTKAGKLVRTLKREASVEKDFTLGLNGLITQWDGKDDAGHPVPPGAYALRGFAVGPLEVSGEAFHGNDWIASEEAPHVASITEIAVLPGDRLQVFGKAAEGAPVSLEAGLDGEAHPTKAARADDLLPLKTALLASLQPGHIAIEQGHLKPATPDAAAAPLPELHQPVDYATGRGGTLWLIDRSAARVEVQQYSAKGEFLRRLSIGAGEPLPEKIAASESSDLLFLLERGEGIQRVRGLALETLNAPLPDPETEAPTGGPKSSTWRVVFNKAIRQCDDFAQAAPQLGRFAKAKPEAKIPIKLQPNPLVQDASTAAEVTVAREAGGSFLYAADGLPLCRLTDTPGLKWVSVVRDGKNLTLLQSDGAVVEEYRLGKLNNLMAFEAGDYEWQ